MSPENTNFDSIYKNDFSQEEIDSINHNVISSFMKEYFSKNIIDNLTYEQNVLKIMKGYIEKSLTVNYVYKKELYKPLASHILKKNFKIIFEYLADSLLFEVAHMNVFVIDFLKYYSQEIIIVDNKKYKVPHIQELNGPRWNVATIPSVIKEYVQAKEEIKRIDKLYKELKEEESTYHVNGLNPYEQNKSIEKELDEIEEQIKLNTKKIEMIHDTMIVFEHDKLSIDKSQEELESAREERSDLKINKSNLIKQKIKQIQLAKYEALLTKIETINREYKQSYQVIQKKEVSYKSIRKALINALTSKKKSI